MSENSPVKAVMLGVGGVALSYAAETDTGKNVMKTCCTQLIKEKVKKLLGIFDEVVVNGTREAQETQETQETFEADKDDESYVTASEGDDTEGDTEDDPMEVSFDGDGRKFYQKVVEAFENGCIDPVHAKLFAEKNLELFFKKKESEQVKEFLEDGEYDEDFSEKYSETYRRKFLKGKSRQKRYIKSQERLSYSQRIRQKNCIKNVEDFINSYVIISGNTQAGKALATLFAEVKAYLLHDIVPVHLTRNITDDIGKLKGTAENLDAILEAYAKYVREVHPEFHACKFPKLEIYDKTDLESWKGALVHREDIVPGNMGTVPVFAILSNKNNVTDEMPKMGRPSKSAKKTKTNSQDAVDRVCALTSFVKTILEKGYVVPEFTAHKNVFNDDGVSEVQKVLIPKSALAAFFTDETDLLINNTIRATSGINGITKSIYSVLKSITGIDEKTGEVHVLTGTFFEMFTMVVDVTATIGSLLYGELETDNRTTKLVEVMPSIYGHQFDGKGCKGIEKHECNDMSDVFTHFLKFSRQKRCSAHALFLCKEKSTKIADQLLQAMKCAAEYTDEKVIPVAGNSEGCVVYVKHDLPVEHETFGSGHSNVEEGTLLEVGEVVIPKGTLPTGKLHATHAIMDYVVNSGRKKQTLRNVFMYKYGPYWETHASLNDRVNAEYHEKISKRDAIRDQREKNFLPRIAADEPLVASRKTAFNAAIKACSFEEKTKISVCEYKMKGKSYQVFLDDLFRSFEHTVSRGLVETYSEGGETFKTGPLLNTACFGRALFDRGANVESEEHLGSLTHLYVNIDCHYDALIHAAGRICGNDYTRCKHDNCAHGLVENGVEQVCLHKTKHMFASPEILDMHEKALMTRKYFLDIARRDPVDGVENMKKKVLEVANLLRELGENKTLLEASLIEQAGVDAYNHLSIFFTKVTGGNFQLEKDLTSTGDKCSSLGLKPKKHEQVYGPGCKRSNLGELVSGSGSGGFAGHVVLSKLPNEDSDAGEDSDDDFEGDGEEVTLDNQKLFDELVEKVKPVYSKDVWGVVANDEFKTHILEQCKDFSGFPVQYIESKTEKTRSGKTFVKKVSKGSSQQQNNCIVLKTLDGNVVGVKQKGRKDRIKESYEEVVTKELKKNNKKNKKMDKKRKADEMESMDVGGGSGSGSGSGSGYENLKVDPSAWRDDFMVFVEDTGKEPTVHSRVPPDLKEFLIRFAEEADESESNTSPIVFHGSRSFTRSEACLVVHSDKQVPSKITLSRKGSKDALKEKYELLCSGGSGGGGGGGDIPTYRIVVDGKDKNMIAYI